MKKVFSLLITLAMIISTVAVPMSASADTTAWDGTAIDTAWVGSGTETDPYLIGSAAELAGLSEKVWSAVNNSTGAVAEGMTAGAGSTANCYNVYSNTYFKLTADIDLGNKEWKPIGRHGARFNGSFDGDGHVVKNISITTSYIGIGLFGATGKNTVIKNLGVENFNENINSAVYGDTKLDELIEFGAVYSFNYIWGSGAMVGLTGGGTFENCYVKDVVFYNAGNSAGGQSVGEAGFGGFAGNDVAINSSSTATFNSCYVMNVKATTADPPAGFMHSKTQNCTLKFNNCYVAGNIEFKCGRPGTVAFANRGTATNCYSMSDVAEGIGTTAATKQNIADNISTATGFVADHAVNSINNGYPVLSWQADWIWDGTVATSFAGGSGTKDDPYLISNGAELAYLSEKVFHAVDNKTNTHLDPTVPIACRNASKDSSAAYPGMDYYDVYMDTYFKLTDDIDLGNREWQPIGRLGARFAGKFDGNGHVVKNVSITKTYQTIGFFGATGGESNNGITNAFELKDFGVEGININVNANGDYGARKIVDWNLYAPSNDGNRWLWASGGMVGTVGGGTFENCYVKDVKFDSGCGTGEGGFGGFFGFPRASYQHIKLNVTNCYVMNVEAYARDSSGGFMHEKGSDASLGKMEITFTNCYVGGIVKLSKNYNSTDGCTAFAKANISCDSLNVENCYTTGTVFGVDKLSETSTQADIVAGLANVDGWYADNATSPINGGYPVLDWQNTWKKPYEVKAIGTADGNVTSVTLKENEALGGTVIVAVYSGTRFLGAVTATAANGEVTLNAPIAVAAGNTVKVFVWGSMEALSPLANAYSTTI